MANAPPRTDPMRLARAYQEMQYPRVLPVYAPLLVDTQGNLWMGSYPVPGNGSVDWVVFSDSGANIGALRVPANLKIVDVGVDYVLGIWRDEVGVDSVRMYSLLK